MFLLSLVRSNMFYILRFYLESKIPEALSSYKQNYYVWTTDPTMAIFFLTKEGAFSALADICANSTTAQQHRFVVAHVDEVPIGRYQGSNIQGFLSW